MAAAKHFDCAENHPSEIAQKQHGEAAEQHVLKATELLAKSRQPVVNARPDGNYNGVMVLNDCTCRDDEDLDMAPPVLNFTRKIKFDADQPDFGEVVSVPVVESLARGDQARWATRMIEWLTGMFALSP